jgi:predicted secreted protein
MAHLLGKAGEVLATATATGIKSWTLDQTQEMIDCTDFADLGRKNFIVGPSEWGGSFEGYKDGAPLAISTAGITLQLKESATTGQIFTGTAYITGFHANVSWDGVVTYSYDYVGCGTLTLATA